MAKQPVFSHGEGILVTTDGPGKLHLYTYGASNPKLVYLPGQFGFVETTRNGVSHFIISHSYYFTKYAFYWDGKGPAEFRIGQRPEKKHVGKDWNHSSWLKLGDKDIWPLEVSPNYFQGAVNKRNQITCFLLPEDI